MGYVEDENVDAGYYYVRKEEESCAVFFGDEAVACPGR